MALTAKTYLNFVNDVIDEGGISLENLTTTTFSTTTDPQHLRVKRHVRDAWTEIQMQRPYTWMRAQGVCPLYPAVYLEQTAGTGVPISGDHLRTSDGTLLLDFLYSTPISGTHTAGTFKGNVYFNGLNDSGSSTTGDIKFGTYLYRYSSAGSLYAGGGAAATFSIKGWGTYDLRNEVSDMYEPDLDSFYIATAADANTYTSLDVSDSASITKLHYLPYTDFMKLRATGYTSGGQGQPMYITQNANGLWEVAPRVDGPHLLQFTYQKEPQELSAHGDTLTGIPVELQDAVLWRALMFYAKFDRKSNGGNDKYYMALDRYRKFQKRLERDCVPEPSFTGWSFY